jgi:hypothetical protein
MLSDSFTHALEGLDPASRALLDLSLRRGMRTDEIADVLGAEPDSIALSRDEALRSVAAAVGMGRDEQLDDVRAHLAELPADQWHGPRNGANGANGNGAAATAAAPPVEEPRGRSKLPLLLAGLAAAAVIAVIALSSGGGSDEPQTQAGTRAKPAPAKQPAPPAKTHAARVTGISGGARGTARLLPGRRLALRLGGLKDPGNAAYQVWLYSSVIDARPLAKANGSRIAVKVQLPASWRRYRYVDVSLEPNDGNVSHSGESVARVATSKLR